MDDEKRLFASFDALKFPRLTFVSGLAIAVRVAEH